MRRERQAPAQGLALVAADAHLPSEKPPPPPLSRCFLCVLSIGSSV